MSIAVVALILFASQLSAYQQQKSEYAFSEEMPEAAQVIRDIQGKDAFDTAVRRRGALSIMGALLDKDLSKRRFPLTVREQALEKAYVDGIYHENQPYNGTPNSYRLYSETMRLMTDRSFTRPLLKRYFSEPALREMEPIVTNIEVWAQGQINQERRRPAADSTPGPWERFLKEYGPFLQGFVRFTVGLLILTLILALRNASGPHLNADSKEALRLPDSLRRIKVFRKEYDVSCQSGKLYDKELWTETNVTTTTSGGGTYQTGETVHTTPITTTTHVSSTVYHRFWLRSPDGREFWRRFSGDEFSATVGQVISTIHSGAVVLMAYNHSTGQFATRRSWFSKLHKLPDTRWGCWIFAAIALAGYLWNIGIVRANLGSYGSIFPTNLEGYTSFFAMCLIGIVWMFAVFIVWGIPAAIFSAIITTTRNRQFEKRFVPAFRHFLEESTPELLARFRTLPT